MTVNILVVWHHSAREFVTLMIDLIAANLLEKVTLEQYILSEKMLCMTNKKMLWTATQNIDWCMRHSFSLSRINISDITQLYTTSHLLGRAQLDARDQAYHWHVQYVFLLPGMAWKTLAD